MLPVLIYVVDVIRRALRKAARSVEIVADSFHEAQECRRKMAHRYMEE